MQEKDFIDPEILKNGNVLLLLKQRFIENRSVETIFPLLCCLRDSQVIVPVNVTMSKEDEEMFLHAQKGDTVTTSGNIRMKPDILQNGDAFFFPMFSNAEQMPEDYAAKFSNINMSVLQCIKMAKTYDKVIGLVLDAFTDPVVLEYQLADIIPRLESRLKPEE